MTQLVDSPPRASFRRAVIVLTLLAFGLRMIDIEARGIWWDESLSLFRARQSIPYILSNRIDIGETLTVDQHPPLYFLLLHGVIRLMGERDLALRFPSVLFATALVPLLYAMGSRLRNRRVGLLAALWGAISPFYLWYAQEARMYTMVTALGLAATYLLWRTFQGPNRRLSGLGFGITAAAALATHYFAVLILAVQAMMAVFLWRQHRAELSTSSTSSPTERPTLRRWMAEHPRVLRGGLPAAVILLSATGFVGNHIARLIRSHAAGRVYVPLHDMLIDALNAFSLGLTVSFRNMWPLELIFLALFGLGLWWAWRHPHREERHRQSIRAARGAAMMLLPGYFLVPILAFWLYSHYAPVYMGSRYIIMSSPAFYLGMSLGLDALWSRRRWVAGLLIAVLVAGMGYSTARYFTHEHYEAKEDHRSSALYVMANERPGDVILLTAPENIFAFRHYYRGQLDIIPLPQPPLTIPDSEELERELASVARHYDRIWLVHCRTFFSDPENQITQWLDGHLLPLERIYFPSYGSGVTVTAYLTDPPEKAAPPEGATPWARYDERLDLLHYTVEYLTADGHTASLRPDALVAGDQTEPAVPGGALLRVRLTWHVPDRLPPLKVSLRLIDEQGISWTQRDRRPLYYWPTDTWPVNTVMYHDADLRIPIGAPPGLYRLEMVLYHENDGRPLVARWPDGQESDAFPLGTVTIERTRESLWPVPEEMATEFVEGTVAHQPAPRFGALRLVGSRIGVGEMAPGQSTDMRLHWLADEDLAGEFTLAVNWVDSGGVVRHTATYPLAGPAKSTCTLAGGEPLTGMYRLTAPDDLPPDRYTLRISVHDDTAGAFMRVRYGLLPSMKRSATLGRVTLLEQ